jgi:hypothetical protein
VSKDVDPVMSTMTRHIGARKSICAKRMVCCAYPMQ